ncbi:hypothetical protein ABT369_28240 [Dactylosporangium sp. NPDC000244]|uniref:hypothetical protein n=1 Tax=Dactylosporangium sp. NPDC000244 TaxID=3154365 RepID=UPI00332C685E
MHPHRTTTPPPAATVPMLTPCPWCATYCTGALRAAHLEFDRQSETSIRRRWAA